MVATPPFDILEAKPADADLASQHPADERAMRDIVESWMNIDHDSVGGRHKIGVGNDATRDAITTWVIGSMFFNTKTSPVTLQRTVSIDPDVWEDIAPGVVPLPITSGGTGAITAAASRTSLAVPGLAGANTFTADQTIVSTDAGPLFAPTFILDRNSASPAVSDRLGRLLFRGRDSTGATVDYASITGVIVDPTNASEDGSIDSATIVAGVSATRLQIRHGLFMNGATGADKGADTINASGYFRDGVAFGARFISANQTISQAGALTLPHSLGVKPFHVQGWLVNLTAELGYSIGDEYGPIAPVSYKPATANQGFSVRRDATNILIKFGSASAVFHITRADTGAAAAITLANWALIIEAEA